MKGNPRAWIRWHLANGQDIAATCERFGISRATLYRWLSRYRETPKKPLTRRSRKPKTRRPPGYTVGQLLAVAIIHDKNPTWGRKRVHAKLSTWHQSAHQVVGRLGFISRDLSFLTSLPVPSEATVGRMLQIVRRRCPFCEGPKGFRGTKRLFRTEGHAALGCIWAVFHLPDEVFDQRLPLAKLRQIVRQSKHKPSKQAEEARVARRFEKMIAAEEKRTLIDEAQQLINRR